MRETLTTILKISALLLAVGLLAGCNRRKAVEQGTMVPDPDDIPSLLAAGLAPMFMPGDTVPEPWIEAIGAERFFSVCEIPDSIFAVMAGKTFKNDCTVPRDSLRYLTCLHRTADSTAVMGEMVLHYSVAQGVLDAFRKLYEAYYPIEKMRLMDNYDADDDASMLDNNSSAFNFRRISRTRLISKHGLGKAVDINPLYNPNYKVMRDSTVLIKPDGSGKYLDRSADFPYKIVRGDLCYQLFRDLGFRWGGDWGNSKDYQHFEMP